MFLKSLPPLVCGGNIGTQLAFDEGLLDGNVAGFFHFSQMGAVIAKRKEGFLYKILDGCQ